MYLPGTLSLKRMFPETLSRKKVELRESERYIFSKATSRVLYIRAELAVMHSFCFCFFGSLIRILLCEVHRRLAVSRTVQIKNVLRTSLTSNVLAI